MKTFSERFGLMDNDLTSPEHDEIMVQLNEKKFAAIFNQTMSATLKEYIKENKLILCSEPSFAIRHEVPIISNGYAVGFLDAVASLDLKVSYSDDPERSHGETLRIPIEVKTKITSYGETLRQLNFYREYFLKSNITNYRRSGLGFLLITKDKTYKEQFEQNGITVYVWEDEQEK